MSMNMVPISHSLLQYQTSKRIKLMGTLCLIN